MKFVLLMNLKLLTTANTFLLNKAEHENFSANNMKMSIIVGFFIVISRGIFMLSWVEREKCFITSGPGHHNIGADKKTGNAYIASRILTHCLLDNNSADAF